MNVSIYSSAELANAAAAGLLAEWLIESEVCQVMLAAGNTPLDLYRRIGESGLPLSRVYLFALDEYVGVPLDHPRNCANLIRRAAVEPWGVLADRYFAVSSLEPEALTSVRQHERRLAEGGGLDVLVLGLGQNGHLGFNEPGSAEDSAGRIVELEPISVEANRQWFGGEYAPARGVTVGMKTILGARRILVVAYGGHKRAAAAAMLKGERTERCPASLLQGHPQVHVFLDEAAAR